MNADKHGKTLYSIANTALIGLTHFLYLLLIFADIALIVLEIVGVSNLYRLNPDMRKLIIIGFFALPGLAYVPIAVVRKLKDEFRYMKHRLHYWDGCMCLICGKTRDERHDWDGCKCLRCGKKRDEGHNWDGCKCLICGEKRDKGHDWDGCLCLRCGKKRDMLHQWNETGCLCRCCGAENHDWELTDSYTVDELPEGIDGCLENMCFIESVTHNTYKCRKCGKSYTD